METTTGLGVAELLAKQACTDVLERVRQAADDGDADAFAGAFAVDGVWRRPGQPPLEGRAAIRAFMAARPAGRITRHVTGGVLVELASPTTATARSQITLYAGATGESLPIAVAGPEKVLEYTDQMELTAERWQIVRRDTQVVFAIG